jgi:hypothetical protein
MDYLLLTSSSLVSISSYAILSNWALQYLQSCFSTSPYNPEIFWDEDNHLLI